MISVSQLIRDHVKVWRSANDIVMTSGMNGRIPVSYIMQMIGVKHDPKYKYDRAGEIWCWTQNNNEVKRENERCNIDGPAISTWEYEVQNDPTTLLPGYNQGWFVPKNPYNLEMPDDAGKPAPRHETILMMQEVPAGQPASVSDGSWIHATGMTDRLSHDQRVSADS